jgi:hypothetical protein
VLLTLKPPRQLRLLRLHSSPPAELDLEHGSARKADLDITAVGLIREAMAMLGFLAIFAGMRAWKSSRVWRQRATTLEMSRTCL